MNIRKNRSTIGDFRPHHSKTAEQTDPTRPQRDKYDDRWAHWFGHKIYLGRDRKERGRDSQVGRLFWLLSEHVGRAYPLVEVQKAIDGVVTDASLGMDEDEVRKADQRIRQVVSRLRKVMSQSGLDDHVVIHRDSLDRGQAMAMIYRHAAPSS